MAYDGNGNWSSTYFPTQDRDADIKILASKFETLIQTNIKSSFEDCATLNSETKLTDNWDFNSKKGINLATGTEDTDAVRLDQLEDYADTGLTNLLSSADSSTSKKGVVELATVSETQIGADALKAVTPYGLAQALSAQTVFPDGYIKGILPSNGTDADHDIDFATGRCRDYANTLNIIVSTGLTKRLDASWASGTGNGGLASALGITADTTYHMFVLAGGITPASAGTFITSDISSNLASFQAISDGYITYQVDGDALVTISSLDFTLASDMDDVATVISNQLTGATVANSSGVLTFTSSTTGSSSSVNLYDQTGTGTNLYDASYLDVSNGTQTNGEDASSGAVDFGFDTSLTATNLLADTNVISAGFNKYRRVGSVLTDASADIIRFTAFSKAGGGIKMQYGGQGIQDVIRTSTLAYQNETISVPPNMEALFNVSGFVTSNSTFQMNIKDNFNGSETVYKFNNGGGNSNEYQVDTRSMMVDSSSQIQVYSLESSPDGQCVIWTTGYIDERI